MSKEVDIALLEKYLANEVDASEVLHSDGSQLTGDELETAILEFKETILQLEGVALKEQLQDLHHSLSSEKKKTHYPQWFKIAASVLLIGIFGTLIWQNNNQNAEFSDYFDHFDQLVTFRDSDSTNYSEGLEAYTRRNYLKAYEALSRIDGLDTELKFYRAVSALGSKKLDSAVVIFEKLGTNSSNKYYQQVKWYLSLTYWRTGKLDQAIALWRTISENEFKYSESQELIELLKD